MTSLLELSHELLHCIFSEIELTDLAALNLTCRDFHNYIHNNRLLHKDLYLHHFDELLPSLNEPDWEQALHNVVKMGKILESEADRDSKAQSLGFVADQIQHLLNSSNPCYDHSRNIQLLNDYFCDTSNIDAFLCASTLFGRAGHDNKKEADTPELRQASAKLHCLYGVPVDHIPTSASLSVQNPDPTLAPSECTRSQAKPLPAHTYARSKVYDLREYTEKSLWGPFMDDGTQRVDWEKVEAIMVVLGFNLLKFTVRTGGRFGSIWDLPWVGAAPNSYDSPPSISIGPTVNDEDDEVTKTRELASALDARDPYGVSGSWMRVVCFLDFHDLYSFNFENSIPKDQPREPIDTEEAIRLIQINLQVVAIEPPGSGDEGEDGDDGLDWSQFKGERLPVVHFRGISRSLHASWDPNANSHIRGTVRQTPEGEIRWTTFSIFHGEERWRSEGIQVGGLRSARGILGNWFDKDFSEHGPAGPTAFWKETDEMEQDITGPYLSY